LRLIRNQLRRAGRFRKTRAVAQRRGHAGRTTAAQRSRSGTSGWRRLWNFAHPRAEVWLRHRRSSESCIRKCALRQLFRRAHRRRTRRRPG